MNLALWLLVLSAVSAFSRWLILIIELVKVRAGLILIFL